MKKLAYFICPILVAAAGIHECNKPESTLVKGVLHKPVLVKGVLQKPSLVKIRPHAKMIVFEGVKQYEGFSPVSYICPGGVLTIGHGFTGKIANRNSISENESSKILKVKLYEYSKIVRSTVKVPLTQSQLWALTSFTYNCGAGNLKKLVDGPDRLNSGNYQSVPILLMKYTKANGKTLNGLKARRLWESAVWNEQI